MYDCNNESTAGADASVEVPKLHNIKLLIAFIHTLYHDLIHDYSLETRPIKIRPGFYCMGDSAHARTELPRIWVTRYTLVNLCKIILVCLLVSFCTNTCLL